LAECRGPACRHQQAPQRQNPGRLEPGDHGRSYASRSRPVHDRWRKQAVPGGEGIGVLHYDADFDILRAKTDLRFEGVWLAPRGKL
jgi:hypothetical protein